MNKYISKKTKADFVKYYIGLTKNLIESDIYCITIFWVQILTPL